MIRPIFLTKGIGFFMLANTAFALGRLLAHIQASKVGKGSVSVPDRLLTLNRKQRHAVLATDAQGQPFASLVVCIHVTQFQTVSEWHKINVVR